MQTARTRTKSGSSGDVRPSGGGLFRAAIAGPGHTLGDAFANLEQAPGLERFWRHPTRNLVSARVALPVHEGAGYFELTQINNDLYVVIQNFAYKDPRLELVPGDGLIQFNFKVSGDMTLGVSRKQPLRYNRPSLLIWAQPVGIDINEWTAPSAHERNVAISVTPEFLSGLLLTSVAEVPQQLQAFVSNRQEQINYCQVPLTVPMFDAVSKLFSNPYTGSLALVYTEALTLELLCNAVGCFSSLSPTPSHEYSDRELRCLNAARDILRRDFSSPHSVRKLARAVGLGEAKLRAAFKAVFGESLIDFSLRCRMQHALVLLRDKRFSVSRTSSEVGYSHPTSFATAFRRHFGMSPKEVRGAKSR